MPRSPLHEPIVTHAPLLAVLSEHLQTEAELALSATTPVQQLLRVGGMLALGRALAREGALLSAALNEHSTVPTTASDE